MAEELERTYVIPLRKVKNVKRTIRAPRAIREVQNFLMKHMKAEGKKLNLMLLLMNLFGKEEFKKFHLK